MKKLLSYAVLFAPLIIKAFGCYSHDTVNEENIVGTWSLTDTTSITCSYYELSIDRLSINGTESFYWKIFDGPDPLTQWNAEITVDTVCLLEIDYCFPYSFLDSMTMVIGKADSSTIWEKIPQELTTVSTFIERHNEALSSCLQ
ncbi:hypothetical protein [Lewinella sp. IMCC34191]|uniref:hypothetical protein n=1 Tax=Lewinella sp. IMCC34191 TaxID=2259172 RepID=UPI001300497D|nr:hypothetical protein [Lewinella sp. IMCC34191]